MDHAIISTIFIAIQGRVISKEKTKFAVQCFELMASSIELVQCTSDRLSKVVPEPADAVKAVGLGGDYV